MHQMQETNVDNLKTNLKFEGFETKRPSRKKKGYEPNAEQPADHLQRRMWVFSICSFWANDNAESSR